jgi:indole-3-glycerol phosphate synthase
MDILAKIYQDKLVEVRNRKKKISAQEICQKINCHETKPKSFIAALQQKLKNNQTAIIAEVKKASPSKGIIRADFDPVAIAKSYAENGAACLSVLTDEKYFMGSDQYLRDIAAAIDLPILRKDFIIDEYQILEAKEMGASCILLIMAMIDEQKAAKLEKFAHEIGLEVLIETHNEEELQRALKLTSPLIGINNRNLKTFEISLDVSRNLVGQIPEERIIICESGIFAREDIVQMQKIGINNFLVGESLMRQDDVGGALRDLLG